MIALDGRVYRHPVNQSTINFSKVRYSVIHTGGLDY